MLYASGRIINGNLHLDSPDLFRRRLDALEGKDLYITITEVKPKRSDALNRYFWGVVIPALKEHHYNETGEKVTDDSLYLYLLTNFAGVTLEVKKVYDKEIITMSGLTSSKMNTEQFMAFLDAIRLHYLNLGVEIPEPTSTGTIQSFLKN